MFSIATSFFSPLQFSLLLIYHGYDFFCSTDWLSKHWESSSFRFSICLWTMAVRYTCSCPSWICIWLPSSSWICCPSICIGIAWNSKKYPCTAAACVLRTTDHQFVTTQCSKYTGYFGMIWSHKGLFTLSNCFRDVSVIKPVGRTLHRQWWRWWQRRTTDS